MEMDTPLHNLIQRNRSNYLFLIYFIFGLSDVKNMVKMCFLNPIANVIGRISFEVNNFGILCIYHKEKKKYIDRPIQTNLSINYYFRTN